MQHSVTGDYTLPSDYQKLCTMYANTSTHVDVPTLCDVPRIRAKRTVDWKQPKFKRRTTKVLAKRGKPVTLPYIKLFLESDHAVVPETITIFDLVAEDVRSISKSREILGMAHVEHKRSQLHSRIKHYDVRTSLFRALSTRPDIIKRVSKEGLILMFTDVLLRIFDNNYETCFSGIVSYLIELHHRLVALNYNCPQETFEEYVVHRIWFTLTGCTVKSHTVEKHGMYSLGDMLHLMNRAHIHTLLWKMVLVRKDRMLLESDPTLLERHPVMFGDRIKLKRIAKLLASWTIIWLNLEFRRC